MSIHLYFSNRSVCNTTISCDSLGIHYTVSKTGSKTSLMRWDSESNSNVLVGEFKRPPFKTHRIKTGQDGQWQVLKEFLYKGEGGTLSRLVDVSWPEWGLTMLQCPFLQRKQRLSLSMENTEINTSGMPASTCDWHLIAKVFPQLTHASPDNDQDILVTYHQNAFSSDPSYLEVSNTSVISGLNNIIRAPNFTLLSTQSLWMLYNQSLSWLWKGGDGKTNPLAIHCCWRLGQPWPEDWISGVFWIIDIPCIDVAIIYYCT